jgi:threonine/homoserine/homoserine lactone efflux protein
MVSFILTLSLAFGIEKYLGAAYLIYLGIKSLLENLKKHMSLLLKRRVTLAHFFRQALLKELINLKTSLFFLAFLTSVCPKCRDSSGLSTLITWTDFRGNEHFVHNFISLPYLFIWDRFFSNKINMLTRCIGKVV